MEHSITITDETTAEDFISRMLDTYGEEFNWQLPPETEIFVKELITELGADDPFVLNRSLSLEAKCESCDDMLFCSAGEDGSLLWRIYHLTWSHCRELNGFPRRTDLPGRKAALEYIRDTFEKDYL